jgi:hypothetical protein
MPNHSQKQSTVPDQPGASHPGLETQEAELSRYGIVSVPITFFDWGGYRYSNARDAISAAKRGSTN